MLGRYGSRLDRMFTGEYGKCSGERALVRHPWEITLREFVEIVRRNYGIEIDPASAAMAGGRFLSKNRRPFPIPVMELDEVIPLPLLRFLCGFYRMPPEDFGLDPEDEG